MKKLSTKYTLQQLNAELNELYNYLKSENYKEEQIRNIFLPVTSKVNRKCSATTYLLLAVMLPIILLYIGTFFDSIYWHISAVTRIALIKILPYFDWRYLKSEHCLIEKFNREHVSGKTPFNCELCEIVNEIDAFEYIDEDILTLYYLDLDVPVMLTKGLEHWPNGSSFVDDLVKDGVFYYSYPCKLSTNIARDSSITAGRVLEKVKSFNTFFLHFQNCDFEPMKIFRKFTFRPDFLPDTHSPIMANWLLWNKNYNVATYKKVSLVEMITVFGQISGSTHLKLVPRENCHESCASLNIKLNAGESVIFTSLWDLEYRPNEEGENMAVILEARG